MLGFRNREVRIGRLATFWDSPLSLGPFYGGPVYSWLQKRPHQNELAAFQGKSDLNDFFCSKLIILDLGNCFTNGFPLTPV